MWLITFPGQDTITILYTNISDQDPMNHSAVSSTLTQYRSDEFIESQIVLTVLRNVSMNGTRLECRSENLTSATEIVHFATSGKCE